jgi:uncharacterized protein YndB with AHSA1/START domain
LDAEAVVIELSFEADIAASAERVFSLLADLRNYGQWLPASSAFYGTTEISDGPIGVGTSYVERSPVGVRHGVVTALLRPIRLDFEQPMTLKPRLLGSIGIKLFHTLTPAAGGVHILRRLELEPHGPVTLLMPLILRAFRAENERMMRTLKAFAERAA